MMVSRQKEYPPKKGPQAMRHGLEYLPAELLFAILGFSDLKSLGALSKASARFRVFVREKAAAICNSIIEQMVINLRIGELFDLHMVNDWLVMAPKVLHLSPSSPGSVNLPFAISIQRQYIWHKDDQSRSILGRFDGIEVFLAPGLQTLYFLESQQSHLRYYQACVNNERTKIKTLENAAKELGVTIMRLRDNAEDTTEALRRLAWHQHQVGRSRKNLLRHHKWLINALKPVAGSLLGIVPEHLQWYWCKEMIGGRRLGNETGSNHAP